MEYLNVQDLADSIPKYLVSVDTDPACEARMVIAENVGEFKLSDLSTVEGSVIAHSSSVYAITIRMLTIMKMLHDVGVVHRDLHGANWIFGDRLDIPGSLRLVDFGLAEFLADLGPKERAEAQATELHSISEVMLQISRDRYYGPDESLTDQITSITSKIVNREIDFSETDLETLIDILESRSEDGDADMIVNLHAPGIPFDLDSDVILWNTVSDLEVFFTDLDPLNSQLDCVHHLQNFKSSQAPRSVTLKSVQVIFDPVLSISQIPENVFEFQALSTNDCLERDRCRHIDSILANKGIESRYLNPQEHGVPWNILFFERRKPLRFGKSGWFLRRRDSYTAAKLAVVILRYLRSLHAVGLVTNGSALGFDLLFKEEDMKQTNFNSVVFSKSSHLALFVDPKTHAYLDPSRRCMFAENNAAFLAPGEYYGMCSTRYDDLYRLSELLLMIVDRELDTSESVIDAKKNWTIRSSIPNGEIFVKFHRNMFDLSKSRDIRRPDYESLINLFEKISSN